MAAVSGKTLPVGLRSAVVFALSATGKPKATNTTAYAGLAWSGPKAFTINAPKPRTFPHYGADRVLNTDVLPPTEASDGTLTVSDYRFDIHEILTGNKVITVGEAKEIGHASNNQGFEPQVGLLLYQQALDLDTGARRYHAYVIPKARVLPSPAGMQDSPQDVSYSVIPQIVTARLWGITLVTGTDGCTSAQFFEYMTETPPAVCSWIGDGNTLEFSFPAAAQCAGAAKGLVTVAGVKISSNLTIAASKITFAAQHAPALNAEVVCFYETA